MSEQFIDKLVRRFLTWPLPQTVCSDLCASDGAYAYPRSGTNLLSAIEAEQMIRHVLSGELDYRAWVEQDPECVSEGTTEGLASAAAMLEAYGPECFPANEEGQVDFARSMMNAVAAEIRAFLAAFGEREQTYAWHLPSKRMPPLHNQVLIELREGAGAVYDVACYLGKHPVEGGGTEDRWLCADVRLDTRQIKRWSFIRPAEAA